MLRYRFKPLPAPLDRCRYAPRRRRRNNNPRPLVRRPHRYLRTPATNTLLSDLGAEVIGNTPIEFSSFVQAEIAKWMRVIPQLGITL